MKKRERQPDDAGEEELVAQAPAIRAFLWHKMKHSKESLHVGVLKFLVQIGDQRPTDNAGPLNRHLDRRLEATLILTLPKSEAETFRILHIHNPKEEFLTSANHLTEEGRKAFFQKKYPPAWARKTRFPPMCS